MFKRNASFAFKSLQIVRYYDPKRKAFAYMVYSDKIHRRLAQKFPIRPLVLQHRPRHATQRRIQSRQQHQHIGACEISANNKPANAAA